MKDVGKYERGRFNTHLQPCAFRIKMVLDTAVHIGSTLQQQPHAI